MPPRYTEAMTPEPPQPASKQDVKEALDQAKVELLEAMRDMQSEILRGLEAFARGNFARLHRLETSDTDLNIRLAALE